MLSAAEITRGVQGALGFLRRDPAAPLHFDNTMEACLRSFRVMALVAPLYAIYLLLSYSNVTTTADEMEIALVEGLHYVVDWLLFPVIFYEIARRRGWLDRYPRYISALNWINLPAMVVAIVGRGHLDGGADCCRDHPRSRPAGAALLLVPDDDADDAQPRAGRSRSCCWSSTGCRRSSSHSSSLATSASSLSPAARS